MGILHYLGLRENFHNIFPGYSVQQVIEKLSAADSEEYKAIINLLREIDETDYKQIIEDIKTESEDVFEVRSEGRATKYYTTRYERDPQNRKAAIRIHGTKCMACGFDFEKFYGARGKDYIEVHHVVPLSSRNEEVEVNPATDLIVVCSNCHRMIHRKKDHVLSLEELKEIIRANGVDRKNI